MTELGWLSAGAIASTIARGEFTATQVIDHTLARIARRNTVLNAFTAVTAERARSRAAAEPAGPLAGVPFAVKNLIDVAGLPTLAGSKINREHAPAREDAALISRPSRRRDSGWRAEHGRIRLRLHRREQPRRPLTQPS